MRNLVNSAEVRDELDKSHDIEFWESVLEDALDELCDVSHEEEFDLWRFEGLEFDSYEEVADYYQERYREIFERIDAAECELAELAA